MTPISSSLPAAATLRGRVREQHGIGPAGGAYPGSPAGGAMAHPRLTLESPGGERIEAAGAVARFEPGEGDPFGGARSWLASLASAARVDGGTPDECLVALFVFPFDAHAASGPSSTLHRAWIPARILRRDAAGRAREIVWRGGDPAAPSFARAERPSPRAAGWTVDAWSAAVETALGRIRSGSLRKVVLARTRVVRRTAAFDTDRIFRALGDSYPECHRYRYESGDGTVFLGASPERLVSLRKGRVEADAVAGTSATDSASLLDDPKERLEHDIVVREVVSALETVTDGVEADRVPEVHRLRNVTHLRTRVRAVARPGTHVLDLAGRIHPSPAVAGAPRDAALDLIRSLEPAPRGWYAGPIGWASAGGEGEFTLGLRAALARGAEALLYAGAGIVLGSDPRREWEETESKMRAMEEAVRG